jgi:hypothetical protein
VDERDVRLGGLTVSMEVTAGLWAVEGVGRWGTVACVVPDRFPAYARVFHPAYRLAQSSAEAGSEAGPEVRWGEVAEANGRVAHAAMEWASITGAYRYLWGYGQPGIWEEAPAMGTMPWRQLTALVDTLSLYTLTPERCWFAIWEGFGDLPYLGSLRPVRLKLPHRDMILLSGPLAALPEVSCSEAWYRIAPAHRSVYYRSPSLWWPEDHSWCVGTDVDRNSSFIGASAECVEALSDDHRLEIMPVSATQTITIDTDTINPKPEGSPDDT